MKMHTFLRSMTRPLGVALAALLLLVSSVQAGRPLTLEERRAELVTLTGRVETLLPQVTATEAAARGAQPAFDAALARIQSVALSGADREALDSRGLDGLAPEARAIFESAGPEFTAHGQRLQSYFAAYDALNTAQIQSIVFGCVLGTLTKAHELESVATDSQKKSVLAQLAEVARAEEKYRNALDDPKAKNWTLVSSSDGVWEATVKADAVLDGLRRKHDLAPGVSMGARLRRLGENIAYYARAAKATVGSVPAIARVTAYLMNPLRKQGDPEKFAGLLRSLGKSYAWASGMKFKVVGREKVPQNTSIVYAMSHRSGMEDAVTMASVMPTDFAFMAAHGVFPGLIEKKLSTQPNLILVGGSKPGHPEERIDAVKASVETLQSGLDLAVFPEGATPTRHQETHPLHRGIDVITKQLGARPVAIVAVGMADPSQDYTDRLKRQSLHGRLDMTVSFSDPIDPLKFRSVPGASGQMLLDVVRAFFHRSLFWSEATTPASSPAQDLGTVPVTEPVPALVPAAAW